MKPCKKSSQEEITKRRGQSESGPDKRIGLPDHVARPEGGDGTRLISRRKFLCTAACAGVAAPFVVPASALGKNGAVTPSERIAMGFIGVGGQGRGHLLGGAWTYLTGGYTGREDVQILGVCDVRQGRREEAVARVNEHYAGTYEKGTYKSCEPYIDFRELLARDDLDAVLIATPIHWHALMSIMAAKAGKDVYCEKPTALTIHESRAVADTVKRYGCVYQAGTQQRSEYDSKFRIACEFVRSGRIGTLKEVYCYLGGAGINWVKKFGPGKPVPEGFEWDLFLGPAPFSPYGTVGEDAHYYGTGSINWGQHHYDIAQWGIGADDTGPVEIDMQNGHVVYRYANGVLLHGCIPPGDVWRQGGALFIGTEGRINVHRDLLDIEPREIAKQPLGPEEVHLNKSISHSGNFLECIRTRQLTMCHGESTHRAISVMLLGGIEEILKRPLKWDPEQERFIDDEEANKMPSVVMRPPWRV